jgi:rubredoxin
MGAGGVGLFCNLARQPFHGTQVPNPTTNKEDVMDKWECPCGYVYDPAEGDPDNNIMPGTAFEDLPEDWVCPKCGAEKQYFEKLD